MRLWSLTGGAWQYRDATYTATWAARPRRSYESSPVLDADGDVAAVRVDRRPRMSRATGSMSGAARAPPIRCVRTREPICARRSSDCRPMGGRSMSGSGRSIAGVWQLHGLHGDGGDRRVGARRSCTTPAPGSTWPPRPWRSRGRAGRTPRGTGSTSAAPRAGPTSGVRTTGANLRTTVTGLPTDGRTLYVRLYSVIAGAWSFTDYTYTAAKTPPPWPSCSRPAPGSTLRATTATFEWTGGIGLVLRYLQIGTSPGGGELYNADPGATSLRTTVAGLPSNGSPVYVRLWSLVGGGWQFRDATYTATSGGSAKAELMSPAPRSTLTATSLLFEWTGGRNVTRSWLYVGSTSAATDLSVRTRARTCARRYRGCRPTGARSMCGCGR